MNYRIAYRVPGNIHWAEVDQRFPTLDDAWEQAKRFVDAHIDEQERIEVRIEKTKESPQ